MNPQVAVLIPAYNAQATIDRALASIPDQPWVQVIVCDDRSDQPLAPNHKFKHAQYQLIRNKQNLGVALSAKAASNHLADSVEYLIELDADDIFLPGGLEGLWSALQQNLDADLAWGDLEIINEETGEHYLRRYGSYFDPWLVRMKNTFSVTTLMRRTSWQKAGASWGNNRLQHQDWYMWLSFARIGAKGLNAGMPIMRYHKSAGGLHLSRKDLSWQRRSKTLEDFDDLVPRVMRKDSQAPKSLQYSMLLIPHLPVNGFRKTRLMTATIALFWAKDGTTFRQRMLEFWRG